MSSLELYSQPLTELAIQTVDINAPVDPRTHAVQLRAFGELLSKEGRLFTVAVAEQAQPSGREVRIAPKDGEPWNIMWYPEKHPAQGEPTKPRLLFDEPIDAVVLTKQGMSGYDWMLQQDEARQPGLTVFQLKFFIAAVIKGIESTNRRTATQQKPLSTIYTR